MAKPREPNVQIMHMHLKAKFVSHSLIYYQLNMSCGNEADDFSNDNQYKNEARPNFVRI